MARALQDTAIRHNVTLQRAGAGAGRDAVKHLREARAWVTDRLAKEGDRIETRKRLRKVLSDIDRRVASILRGYSRELTESLEEVALLEAEFQRRSISRVAGVSVSAAGQKEIVRRALEIPVPVGRAAGGQLLKPVIQDWPDELTERARNAVTIGFSQGNTTREIAQAVAGYADGVLGAAGERSAMTLARTAVTHVSSTARDLTYRANDDVIVGYEWVAVQDSRTSDTCKALDGRIFKLTDDYQPKPPAHPNCRSTTSPVLQPEFAEADDEKGTAASDKTYYEWLKNQPASVQDEALGATKGKIFRNAGLTPEEFKRASVNRLNEPLTVDEMAKRNPKIADYLA